MSDEAETAATDINDTIVSNFRLAGGLQRIYRSGQPDELAEVFEKGKDELAAGDCFFLFEVTLIVDLRMEDQRHSDAFLRGAPGGAFEVVEDLTSPAPRQVLQIAVVDKSKDLDTELKRDFFFKNFGEIGISFLFTFILEHSKSRLLLILQTITVHLEQDPQRKAVVHCSQGKDRTGLVIILVQTACGVPEEQIIDDFTKSKGIQHIAHNDKKHGFLMNQEMLASSDPAIVTDTLKVVQEKYGSLLQYLDDIGFDSSWRERLQQTQT